MTQELGPEKTKALDKYMGVVSLTKPQVKEIILAVYPNAPEPEVARAVMLCATYGLNPLMKHIFLIKFNRWNKGHTEIIGEDWVTVMGIKAKRLLSSRRGSYSYVDNTPRVMTEQEQRTTFGNVYDDRLYVITKGKDPATGAEAVGYGFWLHADKVHGTEKGNSEFNMAAIRSESQMLDRLRPGEMPVGFEVIPEEAAGAIIEGEFKEVPDGTLLGYIDGKPLYYGYDAAGNKIEGDREAAKSPTDKHWCAEHNCAFELKKSRFGQFYSHKLPGPGGGYCKESDQEKKKAAASKVLGLESEGKCPACGVDVKTTNEEDISCPNCGVTIHWQGLIPWIEHPERDPSTIKTLTELFKACNEDFKNAEGVGMQPADVVKALGYSSQTDIAEMPSECYIQIRAARQ